MQSEITKAVKLIQELAAKQKLRSYASTGAGISKASNIPTFRGEGGVWEKYNIEEVGTAEAWLNNPEKIWKLFAEGYAMILNAKPNAAHIALSELETHGFCDTIVTQNVDSLHQKANSQNIVEVHGNFARFRCTKCGTKTMISALPEVIPPLCKCGSMYRPDVILYNELLPEKEIQLAYKTAQKANLVYVVGTSAEVYPTAQLPFLSKENGALVIVFNPEKTKHAKMADVFIKGKCEESLPIFTEKLIQGL
ncbi:MAG: SIR2 family NAD-dependent protein deacylase [Candidatus Heimdallarchaeota archaeon]